MSGTLGNDKGPVYATASRMESILDDAVLACALSADERRSFVLVERGWEDAQLRALSDAVGVLFAALNRYNDPNDTDYTTDALEDAEDNLRLAHAVARRALGVDVREPVLA